MNAKTVNKPRNGAELLVQCLEEQGVQYIFGIPGAKVDTIFDVLADHGPRLILCRHEQNAAFMAGMIGLLTGTPGVCLATSGPGVTNLTTGLSTATCDGYPLVALGGNVRRGMRHIKTHQSLDNVGVMQSVTKYAVEIYDGNSIPEVVVNAFRQSRVPPLGASFISLPQDVLTGSVDAAPIKAIRFGGSGILDIQSVKKAAEIINGAKMPVIFAGVSAGRRKVVQALRNVLNDYPVPVVNTYQASGVLSRELFNCHAGSLGIFQNQPGDKLLERADVIVTIGFDPVEYDPEIWNKNMKGIIITIDDHTPVIDRYYQPEVELRGDIAANIEELAKHLKPRVDDPTANPLVTEVQDALLEAKVRGAEQRGFPIHPLRLIYELRNLIGDDATVVCDVGSLYVWMARYFNSYEPHRLLFSNGQQTLGVALPWAIAVTLARPGEKVVSMSGDGGFLFSAMELETAVREKCSFVHLVWRDGSYDMVKIQQKLKYGRFFGVEFGHIDIVKFAEAFGATGLQINKADEIAPVLSKALSLTGPVIVDVPIDYRDNQSLCATVSEGVGH
ncbi:MAG: Acetolactate synthase [Syntrophorhabdus sp. PtaU1.Bin153]|nr:MAG: Acetolactate synthase [Syntrophorhabdus sp. PtaU1.Bin153]